VQAPSRHHLDEAKIHSPPTPDRNPLRGCPLVLTGGPLRGPLALLTPPPKLAHGPPAPFRIGAALRPDPRLRETGALHVPSELRICSGTTPSTA